MLGTLQSVWAPEAFIVSFKLETDEQILISKVSYLHMKLAHTFIAQRMIAQASIQLLNCL